MTTTSSSFNTANQAGGPVGSGSSTSYTSRPQIAPDTTQGESTLTTSQPGAGLDTTSASAAGGSASSSFSQFAAAAGTEQPSTLMTSSTANGTPASGSSRTASGSQSTNSPSSVSNSNNNNAGAIAGAAIGCFFAGLIIGTILVCWYMRMRKRRNPSRGSANRRYGKGHHSSISHEKAGQVPAVAAVSKFDFLPQPAEDAEVNRRIIGLLTLIDTHIHNYYTNVRINLNPKLESEILRFAPPDLGQSLPTALESSRAPTVIIQSCLTYALFCMAFDPQPNQPSLLPSDLADMITYSIYNMGNPPSKESMLAFSQWKQLTFHLRPELKRSAGEPDYHNSDHIQKLQRLANSFNATFTPWSTPVAPGEEDERLGHLTVLYMRAAETAVWLFSQPDDFALEWTRSDSNQRQGKTKRMHNGGAEGGHDLVSVPRIYKTSHEGVELKRPLVIVREQKQQY